MQLITYNELLQYMSRLLTYEEADMKISMKEIEHFSTSKKLHISTAKYNGFNAVVEATKIILHDFHIGQLNLENSHSVLIHYKVKSKTPTNQITDGMRNIRDSISSDADIYMGISYLDDFPTNYVEATVVLT